METTRPTLVLPWPKPVRVSAFAEVTTNEKPPASVRRTGVPSGGVPGSLVPHESLPNNAADRARHFVHVRPRTSVSYAARLANTKQNGALDAARRHVRCACRATTRHT